jgi:hypothetical protein
VYEIHEDKKNPELSYIIIEKLNTLNAKKDFYSIANKATNWNEEIWSSDAEFNNLKSILNQGS